MMLLLYPFISYNSKLSNYMPYVDKNFNIEFKFYITIKNLIHKNIKIIVDIYNQ